VTAQGRISQSENPRRATWRNVKARRDRSPPESRRARGRPDVLPLGTGEFTQTILRAQVRTASRIVGGRLSSPRYATSNRASARSRLSRDAQRQRATPSTATKEDGRPPTHPIRTTSRCSAVLLRRKIDASPSRKGKDVGSAWATPRGRRRSLSSSPLKFARERVDVRLG